MYRLKMSKYRLLIICLVCKLLRISDCSEKNSTAWSSINLLVDSREYKHGYTDAVQTTETFGIIIKSNQSVTSAPKHLWTKIEVSEPPQKTTTPVDSSSSLFATRYHATLGNVMASVTKAPVGDQTSESDFASSVVDKLMIWANRSLAELNATAEAARKGSNGETGHAFFDLDDDDDDDDDDYDDDDYDDDDDYNKKDKEEIEEVEEVEPNVEETADAVETEPQEEYVENYAETRPPIILRTRRKNKRKRGKKHGHVKIKDFKKLKKFMLPLLLAYKLKFFTLVPLLLAGLVLIVATTGFAGFFFALFAVGLGMKHGHH